MITKKTLPSILQYHYFLSNKDTQNARIIMNAIQEINPFYTELHVILSQHFPIITQEEALVIQVSDCLIDHCFVELYIKIQNKNYDDFEYYVKVIKEYLYNDINIDVDFLMEGIKENSLSMVYVLSLTKFIVTEINSRIIIFFYDYVKLVYLKNTAINPDFFLVYFFSVITKILLKMY
jgi:hypothetical protein